MYALIMAGGGGTRLWPLSRKGKPKQLLKLVSERTMFQEACDRVLRRLSPEQVFVVTGRDQIPLMQEQVPELPPENYIAEPFGRGTAPCIGLSALYLRRCDPEAVMTVLTADHYIEKVEHFLDVLAAAEKVAQEGHLVTLGITPDHPSTGYGYIRRGELLGQVDGFTVYRAEQFTEKPDEATARHFLETGLYSWNSGMFIWRISAVMAEFRRQMPELYAQLMEIDAALGTPQEQEVLERVWPQVQPQTIDYGIMEGARDVAVIPVDIGWSDVGSWASLLDILAADEDGNVVMNVARHLGLDTRRTLVYGQNPRRLIATIGLEDMIVVDTDDVVLICPRSKAQAVREVVKRLQEEGAEEYL